MTIPVLETERLILRAPSIEDHARECLFYADAEHARFVGGAKSAFDCWGIIAGRLGHWQIKGYGFWHLDERASGRYVGRVGLIEPYGWPEREIGWSLMPDALGHGYATEAALAVRDYAYGVLGWTTAISLIDPGNAASEAVATRIGAQFERLHEHPEFGPMYIWRHPAPEALK